MKKFRDYLSEEVKLDSLYTGGIDISRDAVRDEINGIIAGMVSQPCVTPYGTLNKVRKALAYFSIFLPKRSYMEGKHGVEVWDIHQFGDKMGMTDQGEFIKSTPTKFYMFFHYHLCGSMYMVRAKIVDQEELNKELDMAEMMIKEDAAVQQNRAKVTAPHEPMHDETADGEEGTKKAVEVSMRRKDKKLSADKLDEEQIDEISDKTLMSYRSKRLNQIDKMAKDMKSFSKSKNVDPSKFQKHLIGIKTAHKKLAKEETLDEKTAPGYQLWPGEKKKKFFQAPKDKNGKTETQKWAERKQKERESKKDNERLEEKLTKGMKASDVISDFVHSDDPKFKGKSVKQRQKMALGAYYGMHPEKSKMEEAIGAIQTTTGYRKLKAKTGTMVRKSLGKKKEKKTILVTRKGDPHAVSGGGVMRIPADKWDPTKYNMASE